MNSSKKYWNSLEQLNNDPEFEKAANKEFSEHIPFDEFIGKQKENRSSTSRRDFLKFLGFSLTAATLAACETPVIKSIPYVVKPEEITPGVPNYYASSYYDGNDYGSVLVKTREGRPIFIEGNKMSSVTKGRLTARINSSVLSLNSIFAADSASATSCRPCSEFVSQPQTPRDSASPDSTNSR